MQDIVSFLGTDPNTLTNMLGNKICQFMVTSLDNKTISSPTAHCVIPTKHMNEENETNMKIRILKDLICRFHTQDHLVISNNPFST